MIIKVNGYDVIIDDEDFEKCNRGKSLSVDRRNFGVSLYNSGGKPRRILIHRLIMNAPQGLQVDHINGNPLDNRKCNLRLCTMQENSCNQRPMKVGAKKKLTHGFKGVYRNPRKGLNKPWLARIVSKGKYYASGMFKTPDDAAKEYDRLAKIHHGEFARLNFPEA